MRQVLLSIRDLCVEYITDKAAVRALDRISLDLYEGEILGVAGESGCGKSTMARAILRILPPPAVITSGKVVFEGKDILDLDETQLRSIRWEKIAIVFQSAMDALNPVMTVGEQIIDAICAHTSSNFKEARQRALSLLRLVGISSDCLDSYSHQLSGGMRQRVGIALALALNPKILILDEPTTALDVIVEKAILEQIVSLQRSQGFAVLYITHDLGRLIQFSDRIAVFYAGRVVEVAPSSILSSKPAHPYTQSLLGAIPSILPTQKEPESIPGNPPSLITPPSGCRFHPRCSKADQKCSSIEPELRLVQPDHLVACHFAG